MAQTTTVRGHPVRTPSTLWAVLPTITDRTASITAHVSASTRPPRASSQSMPRASPEDLAAL